MWKSRSGRIKAEGANRCLVPETACYYQEHGHRDRQATRDRKLETMHCYKRTPRAHTSDNKNSKQTTAETNETNDGTFHLDYLRTFRATHQ